MTEETATPEATETETPEAPKPTETVDFWKQKSREWEKKAKDNSGAAQKLAEFEERNKSEQERALDQARREASEAATAPLQLQLDRLEVALEKGLTLTQAKRLVGSTRDELAADADALLEEFGSTKPAPAPSFNGGPRATAQASDFNAMLRRAAGRG